MKEQRQRQRQRRVDTSLFTTVGFWSSIGLSLLIRTLYLLSRPEINRIPMPGILEIIEAKTLDIRFRLRGKIDPGQEIVIITEFLSFGTMHKGLHEGGDVPIGVDNGVSGDLLNFGGLLLDERVQQHFKGPHDIA